MTEATAGANGSSRAAAGAGTAATAATAEGAPADGAPAGPSASAASASASASARPRAKAPEDSAPAPSGAQQGERAPPAPPPAPQGPHKHPHAAHPARAPGPEGPTKTQKKRRKVNHACIYCRRSHMTCDLDRPCKRCIKRNIGHLCHDEPRESVKRARTESELDAGENESHADHQQHEHEHEAALPPDKPMAANSMDMSQRPDAPNANAGLNLAAHPLPPNRGASAAPIAQPTPVSAPQLPALASGPQAFMNYNNDWTTSSSQNNFQDMHHFHPSHVFNTSEVSNEYNLLNDFLSSSLMDDNTFYGAGDFQQFLGDPSMTHNNNNPMGTFTNESMFTPSAAPNNTPQLLPPPAQVITAGNSIQRPASSFPTDKARERYYMTAADPAGTDSPEERMSKLLKAKMDAGLLKPFNYVKGYARLNQYMEQHLQQISRVRILRRLDAFRPKFRERMQSLTDMELVRVEMWFDKTLMEYDRVFSSMSMPACCWRRTGEIYRGNKEMADLLHVPMSTLRDGSIALHEIIAESSLVTYWEKFSEIAFDSRHKAILTSCYLKNPDPNSTDPEIKCCFSFTVKRDMYNIPAMIVGNFLPIIETAS